MKYVTRRLLFKDGVNDGDDDCGGVGGVCNQSKVHTTTPAHSRCLECAALYSYITTPTIQSYLSNYSP